MTDLGDNDHVEQVLAERMQQAALGASVGAVLTSKLPLPQQLQQCAQVVVDELDVAFARIWVLHTPDHMLELQASAGMYTHLDGPHGRIPVGAFKIGRIAQLREAHLTNAVADDPDVSDKEWARREGMTAFAGYPLLVGERVVGVLALFARRALSEATLVALGTVASTIALGIARSQAEAVAASEHLLLQNLLMVAPAAICYLQGPEHLVLLANAGYLSALGIRDAVGKPIRAMLPDLEGPGLCDLLDRVYQAGKSFADNEVPLVPRHFEEHQDVALYNVVYQPTHDAGGGVNGILIHAVNVSEQVHARRQLELLSRQQATERDRLRQVLDVLPEGVVIADAQCRLILTNTAAREILGTPQLHAAPAVHAQEATARYHSRHPDGAPYQPEEGLLNRSVFGGEVVRSEQLVVRHGSGQYDVPLLANSAPLRDEMGEIIGGVMTFQDISGIKELEHQKDEFLASVSHDLKNPLTAILGLGQVLLRRAGKLSDEHRSRFTDGLKTINLTAQQMVTQIEELLDLTRLQMARPLDLDLRETDLVALAETVVQRYRQTTERHELRLVTALPAVVCRCDATRLTRMLANLLSNALKYSPEGGMVIVAIDAPEIDWVFLRVQDQGVGVPVDEQPRIFERFYRASNAAGQFPGTGLGLAGVRQIVAQHGGTCTLTSIPGGGTTVTIQLPLAGPVLS